MSMDKLIKQINQHAPLGVLYGGASFEREVSLNSGQRVLGALQECGVNALGLDIGDRPIQQVMESGICSALVMLHGQQGEDGAIQSLLDMLGIPYTGSDAAASAFAFDKYRCKLIWSALGLPISPWVLLDEHSDWEQAIEQLGLPLFVKPARSGSSLGITRVDESMDAAGVEQAWRSAQRYDHLVLAEKAGQGGEFTVAILGESTSPPVRIRPARAFYDYEAKYSRDDTVYECPAQLPEQESNHLQELALQAYRSLGCSGWGRVDFIQGQSGYEIVEVNTVPGMTERSLVPMAWSTQGMEYAEGVLQITATLLQRVKS